MCGICGILTFDERPVEQAEIETMMELLIHRGPDDAGVFIDGALGFGHTRLSIIDLSSAGCQPMFSEDGRYVLIYNGETYNYVELRRQLASHYVFRTQTDTEVVLRAYQRWGEACLERLNGMFAFAIYDRHERTLFAARDRFGIKPFYYYLDSRRFVFASEIRPILALLAVPPEPNDRAIFDYLVFNRTDHTEETFFRSLKKLQHGHTVTIRNGRVAFRRWYRLTDHLGPPFANARQFYDVFKSSVGLRLRSDVPVGVCLSGGLDSSSIVSVLRKDYGLDDLSTFSAVYGAGKRGDESAFISEYRSQLANMFFTHPSHASLAKDVLAFVRAQGEPVPTTSPYAQFKVMELARDHVKVTLDGQGADELLAGYHYFFGFWFKELLLHGRLVHLASELARYFRTHRTTFGMQTFIYLLLPGRLKLKARVFEKACVARALVDQYGRGNVIAERLYGANSVREALLSHFEYKLEHLLKWEDRNSMWFSLEARVPFLDHRLVERTLALPAGQVISGGVTKRILRAAMQGVLPENIRTRRDKVGFDTPASEWFRTSAWQTLILDSLDSRAVADRGYINVRRAMGRAQMHFDGRIDIANELWKWINLELWLREFGDNWSAGLVDTCEIRRRLQSGGDQDGLGVQ